MAHRYVAAGARILGGLAVAAGTSTVAIGGTASASPPVAAAAGGTSCAALPASFGYTEFIPGNVSESNGDSDGPTAFGGTSTLASFGMATVAGEIPSSNVALVAGGPVSGGGTSSVHNGDGYADNNVSGVSFTAGTLHQVAQSQLPVNFSSTSASDVSLASQLAVLQTTAGDLQATSGTTLTLTATGSPADNQYVWDLSSGLLSTITAIKVAGVPSGGTVVVNVPDSGSVAPTVSSITLDGVSASGTGQTTIPLAATTIFNFPSATSLGLTGAWAGAIFAPSAAITFSSGHDYGSIEGASLTGSHESTYGPVGSGLCFDLGPGSSLPEGRPLFLALGGVVVLAGGVLVVGRRRRTSRA